MHIQTYTHTQKHIKLHVYVHAHVHVHTHVLFSSHPNLCVRRTQGPLQPLVEINLDKCSHGSCPPCGLALRAVTHSVTTTRMASTWWGKCTAPRGVFAILVPFASWVPMPLCPSAGGGCTLPPVPAASTPQGCPMKKAGGLPQRSFLFLVSPSLDETPRDGSGCHCMGSFCRKRAGPRCWRLARLAPPRCSTVSTARCSCPHQT